MANQLLNQFQGSASGRLTPSAFPPEVQSTDKQTEVDMPTTIEVAVPTVHNPDDYGFLPGHFSVRHVLGVSPNRPGESHYRVKLDSGERITVSLYNPLTSALSTNPSSW